MMTLACAALTPKMTSATPAPTKITLAQSIPDFFAFLLGRRRTGFP
jgi:hypothetical protein